MVSLVQSPELALENTGARGRTLRGPPSSPLGHLPVALRLPGLGRGWPFFLNAPPFSFLVSPFSSCSGLPSCLSFIVHFKCHVCFIGFLDPGVKIVFLSSGHLEFVTCMLPFITFCLVFHVSCSCSSPSLDCKLLKGCVYPAVLTSAFPTALSILCFESGLPQVPVPLLIRQVTLSLGPQAVSSIKWGNGFYCIG